MKYLTNSGLSYFLNKIKAYIASQLNSKASVLHTHTYSEIVDLPNGYVVDSTLDGTSSNAISNSAVSNALDGKSNTGHTHTSSDITDLYNLIYPIGSIYLSVNSVDPSTLFGGTWEKIKDKFLLSSGDTYSIGSTGGEASHTLTIDEMPSHNHSASTNTTGDHSHNFTKSIFMAGGSEVLYLNDRNFDGILATDNAANGQWMGQNYISESGNHSHTVTVNNTGSNKQHNNMPPYLTINVWKRVA